MELLIDDAHIERIKDIYEFFPVDGVTTNPTILAKAGGVPYETLKDIRSFIGPDAQLHVQAVSRTAEGMIREAGKIRAELGDGTLIKIPAVPEGFKAMRKLVRHDFSVTATAVYSPMQAFLAAKCGATYVAPYINRIDNLGYNGVAVALTIQKIFRNNGFPTKILAASFKNTQQLQELCENGVAAATVAPDVLESLVRSPVVADAVSAFINDFAGLVGQGKTMLDE